MMVFKLLSVLLRYPDEEVISAREEIAETVRDLLDCAAKESMMRFLLYWEQTPAIKLRTDYAHTFDFAAKNCLYLTYFRHGDQRVRGQILAGIKEVYARAGYALETSELPDYLPVMLEFAAERPEEGISLISSYRGGLEVIRKALIQRKSPYSHLIEALRSELPEIEESDVQEARNLVVHGPPREEVGLEPYGDQKQSNVVFHGRKR